MAMASKTAATEWRGTSDHNVTETAFDATKCKLSAVTQQYFQDDFLRFFVEKPTRRIPLIHRGYYLRHLAITRCVDLFLQQHASTSVNIVSLGAGFDTLFFRLLQQQQATDLHFVEVDCHSIVTAKTGLLTDDSVRQGLFPTTKSVAVSPSNAEVAWQCHVSSAPASDVAYSLLACDLGDLTRLEAVLTAANVNRSLPTLILAECVVSYLAPEKGTALLHWLSQQFPRGSMVLYDPIGLHADSSNGFDQEKAVETPAKTDTNAFGATLQRYFAVKGCTLRGARGFQSAGDHVHRLLALARWQSCRIVDMNGVFAVCTSPTERRRLAALEPFDEFADWALSNAHYAIYLVSNSSENSPWTSRFVPPEQQHWLLVAARAVALRQPDATVAVVRSFQPNDLEAARQLFESSHLEFAAGSRAVRQFVANRLRAPAGDMADVQAAFQRPQPGQPSGFWVAEVDGAVVGCVGLKPLHGDPQLAELCRVSVAPAFRRRGLASALVHVAERLVIDSGVYREIRLETIAKMTGAQALYRALGYEELQEAQADSSRGGSFTLVRFRKTLSLSEEADVVANASPL